MITFSNEFSDLSLFWITNSVLAFVISAFCAGVLIPQILLISFRKRLFDIPDERKIHKSAVPRLGGIAFKPVVFFSVAFMLGTSQLLGFGDFMDEIAKESGFLAFGFCAILILYLVGIADDLIGIRYIAKFITQISCALMIIGGGVWINDLYGLFYIYEIPSWVGYILSVLAVVFIINAINLIDGIDGLASGLCGVAMIFYGVIFFIMHEYIYAILSFATLGVLVPFFYFNVFGDPNKRTKIFMGDTGSLTVGMVICILSLRMAHHLPSDITFIEANTFILAFSPLVIPCFDVVRVYLHRVKNGKNPFMPDKNHIHHKMLAIGMKQRTAMITIVLISVCLTMFNILFSRYCNITILLVIDITLWVLGNIWLTRRIRQIKEEKKAEISIKSIKIE